ncbi:MAG TPA: alpha/beta fold hydrolase [Terriglobales bacterium]|nr:alpha/beta fold hydrolase [Terriglobales bacterium]
MTRKARAIFSTAVIVTMVGIAFAAENGKTFEAPGATIYYEVMGTGKGMPLIVVNGGPGFDHTYLHASDAWESIARTRPVVFYDQRGTGRSVGEHPKQTFRLKDQIDDLDALRARLGYEQIDLIGHSWGGFLVMAYAAMHSDHVSHLTIMDSMAPGGFKDTIFLFKDVFPEGTDRQAAEAFSIGMGDKKAVAADLHEYLSMLFYSPEKRDAFLARFSASAYNREVNRAVGAELDGFDLNPEIKKFKFPVLVVTGRYDMNVAPLVAYKIHSAIPNSQFVVFERSGHLPFYEEPEAFVETMENFLVGERQQ